MRRVAAVTGLLWTVLASGAYAGTEHNLHLERRIEGVLCTTDVFAKLEASVRYTSELSITCVGKNGLAGQYSEEFTGTGSRGAYYSDNDELITLWSAASTNWVRIYFVRGGQVRKVLDQPSQIDPIFSWTKDGRRLVAVRNDTAGMYVADPSLSKEAARRIERESTTYFVWDGTSYIEYHK